MKKLSSMKAMPVSSKVLNRLSIAKITFFALSTVLILMILGGNIRIALLN